MTYKELLEHPEWKIKRKEIILRDKLECSICKNESLTNQALIGQLFFLKKNDEGLLYKYIHNKESSGFILRKVFIRRDLLISSMQSEKDKVAFINMDSIHQSKFVNVIAIRECEQCDYQNIFSKDFLNDIVKQKRELIQNAGRPEKYIWKYVPALHVHHTYYQLNLFPWEYPNESLQTLCWVCHEKVHKDQSIPYLDSNGRNIGHLSPCKRCYGAGWFPEYKHIQEGICFRCNGAKYEELIIET